MAMESPYTSHMSSAPRRQDRRKSFDELWEDLLQVPEGFIGEIVDGRIIETQRPGSGHSMAASDLGALLVNAFRFGIGGPGGWRILDEPGIRFGDDMRIPDLAGWRLDRFALPAGNGPFTVAPDWIGEVLSPSTARTDRTDKLPLYARHEVRHVWLLDAAIQTLEVLRLEQGRWVLVATHGGDARVRAEPFEAVELDLSMVWGSPTVSPLPPPP